MTEQEQHRSRLGRLAARSRIAGRALGSLAGELAGGRGGSPGAVVLAYHDVLPDRDGLIKYAVTIRRFRQHLDVLARLGWRVVPLHEISSRLVHGQDVTRLAAIVFDDALIGVHHLAMPELAARGWPATLHPVVDRLGADPPWWPGSRRTMTWAELAEACRLGLDVGGHGTTHACLPCLGDAELAEELRVPRWRLEALVGRAVAELAYPFGHHDERVREAARTAGYATAFAFVNGRVISGADRWALPRIAVHEGLSPAHLALQLARRAADWPAVGQDAFHPPHAP